MIWKKQEAEYMLQQTRKRSIKAISRKRKLRNIYYSRQCRRKIFCTYSSRTFTNSCCGVDIDKLMKGARFAQDKYCDADLKYNECYQYAVARNILYKDDKNIEILANYEPKMHYVTEWWKQLYGESEGKDGKGIFPTGVDFTTDLHSLGQYIQEGRRNLFETVIRIEKPGSDISINLDEDDLDGLNYLVGKSLDFVNKKQWKVQ